MNNKLKFDPQNLNFSDHFIPPKISDNSHIFLFIISYLNRHCILLYKQKNSQFLMTHHSSSAVIFLVYFFIETLEFFIYFYFTYTRANFHF